MIDEGLSCTDEDCDGTFEYVTENCSCHINPPCESCINATLACTKCGLEDQE
jgi:hypothetical protein